MSRACSQPRVYVLRVLVGPPRSGHPLESAADPLVPPGAGLFRSTAGCAAPERPVSELSHAVGFVTAASLTNASERTVTSHRVWHRPWSFDE